MNGLVQSVLNTPQSAAMLIAGGIGIVLHYGCAVCTKRRFEAGRLMMFAASAAGMVAGVYVFFEALKSVYSASTPLGFQQNAVWAGIGGGCVAMFTFDLLLNELRSFFNKREQTVDPILTVPTVESDQRSIPQSPKPTTHAD
jgi:uncharacterized membrane protein